MKKALLVLAFVCFLGSVSSFACSHCSLNQCIGGEASGNCKCDKAHPCAACGFCYVWVCLQGCGATATDPASIIRVADEPKRAPGRAFWLYDENLTKSLQNVSPTMAVLLKAEQGKLSKDYCTNFRNGTVQDATRPDRIYHWEMFSIGEDGSSVHYRIVETNEVLTVVAAFWTFEKNFKMIIEDGRIATGQAELPPIIDGVPTIPSIMNGVPGI